MKARSKTQAADLWNEHFESWKASQLTQKAYCKQEGISYRSFVHHRNRLMSRSKSVSLNFIEAKPEPTVTINQASGLQLMLPNGIRINIGAEMNPALLQTVLSVAGAIEC